MPPNFLSKFVKSSQTPDRPSDRDRSPALRATTLAGPADKRSIPSTASSPSPSPITAPRLLVTNDLGGSPAVPPSPASTHRPDLHSQSRNRRSSTTPHPGGSPASALSQEISINVVDELTPVQSRPGQPFPASASHPAGLGLELDPHVTAASGQVTPSGSHTQPNPPAGPAANTVKSKSSSKSIRSVSSQHAREESGNVGEQLKQRRASSTAQMQPIVESPTADRTTFNISYGHARSPSSPTVSPSATLSSHDADAASILSASTGSGGKKGKPWRKTSLNNKQRKPTGLASAIAASGLAMANPGMTMSPPPMPNNVPTATNNSNNPYHQQRDVMSQGRSGGRSERRTRAASTSANSIGQTDEYAHNNGLGSASTEYHSDDDESDLLSDELDLNDDIPVTGFAVASSKRNADFHELFPSVPDGDYLIEDYGCALQREILIQGRFYISENHICFHANIFGWITDLTVPIYEITTLEKKMTAFVIPNAIQISTHTSKYTFASFLSRDTTYDVVYNIWRLSRPDAETISLGSGGAYSPRGSLEDTSLRAVTDNPSASAVNRNSDSDHSTAPAQKVTQCPCSKEGRHYSELAMEVILPGTPEKIYNLIFTSGFIKDFMRQDQKLLDIQISDWSRVGSSHLLSRNFSYIKPLSGSIGPKQTKCELTDETEFCDFNVAVVTITTTRTPDVPSGSVFAVKTRTCITWASSATTRVVVTSQVEWSGRSFIKSIIEKSALEGQKVYHRDLERAMRAYIAEHKTEFIPEGLDLAVVEGQAEIAQALTPAVVTSPKNEFPHEDEFKRREHERNQRGLQWAWDTLMGAWKVAKQSTMGALDLINDAWDQSSSTTILYFVIVILVISNIWTFALVGRREEIGRRKEVRRNEEKEKWVQGVVAGLWEELAAGKSMFPSPEWQSPPSQGDIQDRPSEIQHITKILDDIEARIQRLRRNVHDLETLD